MPKHILIAGGSSGLGLELAKLYAAQGHTVFITGRVDPNLPGLRFFALPIRHSSEELIGCIGQVLAQIEKVDMFIYAAGYSQQGSLDRLGDREILKMINVGLTAPALLAQRLKHNPGKPLEIIFITSSSQYTPRAVEPMYTTVKAGLGMLGASLSLDPDIGKVLVAAPSGMRTPFWEPGKDTSEYLDPQWVAGQILELFAGPFKYRYAKILRSPARVEIVETRAP